MKLADFTEEECNNKVLQRQVQRSCPGGSLLKANQMISPHPSESVAQPSGSSNPPFITPLIANDTSIGKPVGADTGHGDGENAAASSLASAPLPKRPKIRNTSNQAQKRRVHE